VCHFCVVKIFDGWGQVPLTDRMGHGRISPTWIRRWVRYLRRYSPWPANCAPELCRSHPVVSDIGNSLWKFRSCELLKLVVYFYVLLFSWSKSVSSVVFVKRRGDIVQKCTRFCSRLCLLIWWTFCTLVAGTPGTTSLNWGNTLLPLGSYRIAIFKIRPEPDSTGYQTNYPAGTGTGYMDTCCIIANFLVYFVVRIKMYYSLCLFSALCAHRTITLSCSHTA